MDLGLFLSNRKKKICCVTGPVLCVIIISILFSGYFRFVFGNLNERKSFIESLPLMTNKISLAKSIVDNYQVSSANAAEAIESINSQLNQMAQRSSLTINSLVVKTDESDSKVKASVFKAEVRCEGKLSSIVGFLNDIYSPQALITIDKATIKMIRQTTENLYSADFIFSYHIL